MRYTDPRLVLALGGELIAERTLLDAHAALERSAHGDLPAWLAALDTLPSVSDPDCAFNQARVRIGRSEDLDPDQHRALVTGLQSLHPWRKGPFEVFGVHIDSEWRSDWKWSRLEAAGIDWQGRRVLDVGCGNGYYGWRMLGAGAASVVGIDPTLKFVVQYGACARYLHGHPAWVLPLALENFPPQLKFDTVCSMGVLYHRRVPEDHLSRLHGHLTPSGLLVLETLVIPGENDQLWTPPGRYARMRNLWSLPTSTALQRMLHDTGFRDIQVHDVSITSRQEQRRTAWMRFHSLADFLDPEDPAKTVEGHPRPRRALVTARRRALQ